jgi:DNA polymerase III alpha subunit (gram-positive type)
MVENVITSRLEIQGYENIKQIKDEITKLRQQMKELATGTEEYKATADKLVQTEYQLKTAMSNAKKDNSALKGSYNDLQNQLTSLKKVWKETTDEAVRADYGAQINELNTALKELGVFISNDVTVGFNIRKFDMKILKRECVRNHAEMPVRQIIDLLEIVRRSVVGLKSFKLKEVAAFLGISIDDEIHSVINDCILCNRVYQLCLEK